MHNFIILENSLSYKMILLQNPQKCHCERPEGARQSDFILIKQRLLRRYRSSQRQEKGILQQNLKL